MTWILLCVWYEKKTNNDTIFRICPLSRQASVNTPKRMFIYKERNECERRKKICSQQEMLPSLNCITIATIAKDIDSEKKSNHWIKRIECYFMLFFGFLGEMTCLYSQQEIKLVAFVVWSLLNITLSYTLSHTQHLWLIRRIYDLSDFLYILASSRKLEIIFPHHFGSEINTISVSSRWTWTSCQSQYRLIHIV